jgi:hypothetical protein
MSGSPFAPAIIFATLVIVVASLIGWWALKSTRAQEQRQKELIALSRHAIELSESGQKLQAESNSLMRELIAEYRASRQAPGPDPAGRE